MIGLFAAGFYFGNTEQVEQALIAWVLANGVFSALATAIALGHPLSVITAFIAAPITSLNPTIGAGMVTGFVQAVFASPTVRDMENVGDDVVHWTGFWKNRFCRVLLVFVFSNLGSSIGTFVSFNWLKDLI